MTVDFHSQSLFSTTSCKRMITAAGASTSPQRVQKENSPETSAVRMSAVGAILLMTVLLAGCTSEKPSPPMTDEAMKRAIAEGVSLQTASDYFFYYPKKETETQKYDASNAASSTVNLNDDRTVYDYFPGMDGISQTLTEPPESSLCITSAQPSNTTNITAPAQIFPDPLLDLQSSGSNDQLAIWRKVVSPQLTTNERIGRNTWMVWCAGNEGFWDWLASDSLGFIDLLKLVDTRERDKRFRDAGLINEPDMDRASAPAPGEFGLWLDLPEREEIRRWRAAYVKRTFTEIGAGRHKSQVGLRKRTLYGEYDGNPLYVGDPAAFKGQGYLYPSAYLKPESSDSYAGWGNATYSETDKLYDETIPPPDLYGLSSGVIGLRLFPNPYFDEEARQKWDPERYYNDRSYYSDPNLIRPYRVGMSCAFCHTSFHPLAPPSDVNHPDWFNLSGSIGAQYLRMRATVGNLLTPDQFVYHLLDSQPPGTIDTSLIASDNINNPNTMNAIFGLRQRALLSFFNAQEMLSDASTRLPSLYVKPDSDSPIDSQDVVPESLKQDLARLGLLKGLENSNSNVRHVPRILLDGSDSIGTYGALARVYLNIGSYWEQWNQLHQVVVGFTPQSPFRLSDCETNSVYWNATSRRVPGLRDYFLKITPPMPLLSTPCAEKLLEPIDEQTLRQRSADEGQSFAELYARERAQRIDISKLAHGRKVFARACIVCHSSIQPESMQLMGEVTVKEKSLDDKFCKLIKKRQDVRLPARDNGEFWEHDPAQWLNNDEYVRWALEVVELPEFWTENYLSIDYRIPVNVVGTNSARAMATNGMTNHMWADFASESYRQLPSPGPISYFNPYAGEQGEILSFMPRHTAPEGAPRGGGGPGYYRVPSLISIWATAPFLHNNSLGIFNNDPSVAGRLEAFDDAIRKLLWPDKRLESSSYNNATPERLQQDHGLIWRTTQESYLALDAKRVPSIARRLVPIVSPYGRFPWLQHVRPLLLPSAILLAGSLLLLLLSNSSHRRTIGWVLIIAGALLGWSVWLVQTYPQLYLLSWISQVSPWWLPALALLVVGFALLLPLKRIWIRYLGYFVLLVSLLGGAVIAFNAGKLGDLRLGPIPAGTPVNLLANFNPESDRKAQVKAFYTTSAGLAEIDSRHLQGDDAAAVMRQKIAPALLDVNKCPDFVMDRGHYFPWFNNLTDSDKDALIELLKTL